MPVSYVLPYSLRATESRDQESFAHGWGSSEDLSGVVGTQSLLSKTTFISSTKASFSLPWFRLFPPHWHVVLPLPHAERRCGPCIPTPHSYEGHPPWSRQRTDKATYSLQEAWCQQLADSSGALMGHELHFPNLCLKLRK